MSAVIADDAAPAPGVFVEAKGLRKVFSERGRPVHAVSDVSFRLMSSQVLGLVGESGSGKSTLGRMVLRLIEPTAGQVTIDGTDISALDPTSLRRFRRHMQMVFQDPNASLNPRMTIGDALRESLLLHGVCSRAEANQHAARLLERVGLETDSLDRYPRAFSGGQRQRVAIARALAPGPRLLVADEPVSALDVSVQAEVVNLLIDLQQGLALSMLFISHDLSVVQTIADRVMVLYLGRTMEIAPTRRLFATPRHPYTAALLSAAPGDRYRVRKTMLSGEMPSATDPPSGCVFRTRCPHALPSCAAETPPLREVATDHFKACLRDDLEF